MKAVILAAGYGTRFLPVTRVVPKELLPVVDRPALDLVVEELANAGVTDLLVIGSRRKRAVEDWFDRDVELEGAVGPDKAALVVPPQMRVTFVRQPRMTGTGDALLLARTFAGHDPVVVVYPDDLFEACAAQQVLEMAQRTACSVLAAQELAPGEDPSRYGILDVEERGGFLYLKRIVEKPPRGTEPSRLASWGRYVYRPEMFERLAGLRSPDHVGEYYHVGAVNALAAEGRVVVCKIAGARYDTGTPAGYLKTVIEHALKREDVGPELRDWLTERLGR